MHDDHGLNAGPRSLEVVADELWGLSVFMDNGLGWREGGVRAVYLFVV